MSSKHKATLDNRILSLFWERNEDAIKNTEDHYGKYLYAVAFNVLHNEESSKECVNDALFYFWTHIPPDRPNWFKGYIARITRSLALDRCKEKTRQKRVPEDLILPLDDLINYLQDGLDIEKEIDSKLLASLLDNFIKSLNKSQRVIFIGKYYCFYTIAQIAELLHINERQVFRELAKIKENLKEVLRKEGYVDV